MRRDRYYLLTVLTVLTVVLAGCSGGSDPIPNTGTLTVGLIDMPVRDVDEVWVCITQINIKPQSGPPLEFPFPDADGEMGPCDGEQFDLLTLQSVANAELLIAGTEVPAGFYPWMELELDATPPGQGPDADGPYDSYVKVGDSMHDLIMPSGRVHLGSGFFVTAGQHAQLTIDWDTQVGLSGIVDPQGQEGYILRPAFRIIDDTAFGTLNGTIANDFVTALENDCNADDTGTMDWDAGNVVYLFTSGDAPDDVVPDDTDGIAPDPYATVMVMPNDDATAYVYETIVAPGNYELAFTCQGNNDQPDVDDNNDTQMNVEFHPEGGLPVTISEGETTTFGCTVAAGCTLTE